MTEKEYLSIGEQLKEKLKNGEITKQGFFREAIKVTMEYLKTKKEVS